MSTPDTTRTTADWTARRKAKAAERTRLIASTKAAAKERREIDATRWWAIQGQSRRLIRLKPSDYGHSARKA